MAAVKTNLGIMPCEGRDCGHDVMVKQNEAGTLTYQCGLGCDVSSFAKRGTKAQERWRRNIRPEPAAASRELAPAPAPGSLPKAPAQTPPTPVPLPVKKAQPFDPLGYLKGSPT
jgi:hypothetical protein